MTWYGGSGYIKCNGCNKDILFRIDNLSKCASSISISNNSSSKYAFLCQDCVGNHQIVIRRVKTEYEDVEVL